MMCVATGTWVFPVVTASIIYCRKEINGDSKCFDRPTTSISRLNQVDIGDYYIPLPSTITLGDIYRLVAGVELIGGGG